MDVTIKSPEFHNPDYVIAESKIDADTLICASRCIKTGNFVYEVYSGENYVVGSTKRSYSRSYKEFRKLPGKYQLDMNLLEGVAEQYATGKKMGKFFNV
jgi:hypothetical protein